MSEPLSAVLEMAIRDRVDRTRRDYAGLTMTLPESDREVLLAEVDRLRARRPCWEAIRDLAIEIRDNQPTDAEVLDAVLDLWGDAEQQAIADLAALRQGVRATVTAVRADGLGLAAACTRLDQLTGGETP